MKLPKTGKFYYGMAGGSILLAAGILYLQKNSLDDLGSQVTVLRQKANAQKGAGEKLQQSQRDLVTLQGQLAHLEQGIPDAAYVPTMLKELEALGKTDGVEVTGLKPVTKKTSMVAQPEKKSQAKPYEPLDLELKGKSSYSDTLKFVTALNTFPKILEVRTLTIVPPANSSRSGDTRLEVTVGLRAFLFKQPVQQKKEDLSS